jgi:hypothetical protein
VALKILTDNAALFRKITNYAIKGAYHSQVAMILRVLTLPGVKNDYLLQAVDQYQQADQSFKLAHNNAYRADVKNNVGNLLRQLSRFRRLTNTSKKLDGFRLE